MPTSPPIKANQTEHFINEIPPMPYRIALVSFLSAFMFQKSLCSRHISSRLASRKERFIYLTFPRILRLSAILIGHCAAALLTINLERFLHQTRRIARHIWTGVTNGTKPQRQLHFKKGGLMDGGISPHGVSIPVSLFFSDSCSESWTNSVRSCGDQLVSAGDLMKTLICFH